MPVNAGLPSNAERMKMPLLPPLLIRNSKRKTKFSYCLSDRSHPPPSPVQTRNSHPQLSTQAFPSHAISVKSLPLKRGTNPLFSLLGGRHLPELHKRNRKSDNAKHRPPSHLNRLLFPNG